MAVFLHMEPDSVADDNASGWRVHGWRARLKVRQSSVCAGVKELIVVGVSFNADIVILLLFSIFPF